jgi:L-threonylcarbamoyladenylate synthase
MINHIDKSLQILKKGGTILYPTDTVWGIGCDATSSKAVAKVYTIKSRSETKSMIILLNDAEKIKDYVKEYPKYVTDLIESYNKPLTIVFPGARNLAKNLIAEDGSIAIRIVKHDFCSQLIAKFGKPIVSTSANISGSPAPAAFRDISDYIKKKVDLVVDMDQNIITPARPSSIIKIDSNGSYSVIRL